MQSSFRSVSWLDLASATRNCNPSLPRGSPFASLPPFVPAPRVSLIRMQKTSRANRRARCSSRFRLRVVQIYDSRDFYLIPTRARQSTFVSSRENFPECLASLDRVVCVRARTIESQLLRTNAVRLVCRCNATVVFEN